MHLEGPWLSTTGKKKGKQKHRNASSAQKAREQKESWDALLAKYEVQPAKKKKKPAALKLTYDYRGKGEELPSHKFTGGACTKSTDAKVYTGTAMKGICTMHKSNAVPVFTEEAATDISRMRR